MACQGCSSDWFWQKLGRCRQCMILNALLLIIGLICLWYSDNLTAVYRVIAIFISAAAGLLLLAHLVMALYYKISGDSKLN
ncbi:DUF3624 family protein [Celerinatantimonas sp. MCCC 1A17872]|uniref:DUF3624 family protein n=1 Tax=Celerinatantimonas sp. MCCC 1A17872 TaxID=3177514 RepID=UPI0038C291D3